MPNRNTLVLSASLGALIAAGGYTVLSSDNTGWPAETARAAEQPTPSSAAIQSDAGKTVDPFQKIPPPTAMAMMLMQRYPVLDNPSAKLSMIDALMSSLKEQHPKDWKKRFIELMREAYPDQADKLIAMMESYLSLGKSLEKIKTENAYTTKEELRDLIWDARRAAFGSDADIIWATALKNEAFEDRLKNINDSASGINDQKDQFFSSIREIYGSDATKSNPVNSVALFFEVDGVQKNLTTMPVAERAEFLRQFRIDSGMDHEALSRWDELDAAREKEWVDGYQYMEKRKEIAQDAAALEKLRVSIFGQEQAIQIAHEESAGFYRFDQPRKFGLN